MRLALAAAVLLLWALADVSPALYRPGEAIDTDVYRSGEMLLHRIKYRATTENFHLPLSSVSSALISRHGPPGADAAWRRLSAAAAFVLLLALGCELGGPWLGLLGAAALLFVSRFPLPVQLTESWHGHWGHLQSFFALIVLTAAGFVVRFARAPSAAGAWAVALALGAALLYRSTLVFFPPLLALLYALGLKRSPSREDWRTMAVIGLAPYAFLLPWTAANWAVHGRFIPLEDGEAAPIIVGGVLGAVEKEWAQPPAALGIAVRGTGEALAWAAGRIAADPGAYLLGYARRLWFILLLNPLLFLFAALSFWLNRRKREFQALGLLCAYWVLTHACMSMLREYFDPLWPLLAAAAAAGLTPFLKKAGPSPRAQEASGLALGGFLAVLLALCLFVSGAVLAYARAMTRGGAAAEAARLDAAIARHPDEGELYFERAMRRLESGGPVVEAAPDLAEAFRLSPGNPLIARMAHWSGVYLRAAAGDERAAGLVAVELLAAEPLPSAFLEAPCARVRRHPRLRPACLARALTRAEDPAAPRSAVLAALAEAERLDPGPAENRRLFRLYRGLGERTPARAALARLVAAEPLSVPLRLESAQAAHEAGDARAALGHLDAARRAGPDAAELARIDALARDVSARAPTPGEAAALARTAERRREAAEGAGRAAAAARERAARTAESALSRAANAARAGRRETARALLREALTADPGEGARRRAAAVYSEMRDLAPAAALLDDLLGKAPADPGLLVERAALSVAAGDRARAAALLGSARRLSPAAADRRRMAFLHQDLGDHASALALLDALVRENPKDASLRADRGLSLHLNGRKPEAIAELETALALDPGLRAAASTLSAIRAGR